MAQDIVFDFVKSLDRSEKGYFKKFAQRYGDKKGGQAYLLLFDLMDKAKTYDENKLKLDLSKKYKNPNLSALKKYLRDQLMKAMRNFHSGSSVRIHLMELMKDMEVLSSKGLYLQLEETYNEARKICMENNIALTQLQLNYYWQLLLIRRYTPSESDIMEPFRAEQEKLMQEYSTNLQLSRLESKITEYLVRLRNHSGEAVKKQTAGFLSNPVFQNLSELTPRQQSVVWNILHQYYSLCEMKKEAVESLKKRIGIIESAYKDPLKSGQDYIITLYNMINSLEENAAEYDYYLKKLQALKTNTEAQSTYKRDTLFRLNMQKLCRQEKITADSVIAAEKEYESYPLPVKYDTRISNAQCFAELFYRVGDHNRALKWLLSEFEEDEHRFDSFAINNALLKTMIYIEKREPSLAVSTIQSAIYHIKRYHTDNLGFIKIFQCLNKITDSTDSAERNKHLKEFELLSGTENYHIKNSVLRDWTTRLRNRKEKY